MKKNFLQTRTPYRPNDWDNHIHENFWLDSNRLRIDALEDRDFTYVEGEGYLNYEVKRRINIFSFGKATFWLKVTMIGLPVSIDSYGYEGNLERLLKDYRRRFGLFMLLNIRDASIIPIEIPTGKTLPNCVFVNRFDSFDHYLRCLRSSYRRRINKALDASEALEWQSIPCSEFTDAHYQLYLQVLNHSHYPLETLPIEYFKDSEDELYILCLHDRPLAFVLFKEWEEKGFFLFGGMDYHERDRYDLYYGMLLFLVKTGISRGLKTVSFGQTAESAKQRVGCVLEDRYMCVFTRFRSVNRLLRALIPFMDNRQKQDGYRVFVEEPL